MIINQNDDKLLIFEENEEKFSDNNTMFINNRKMTEIEIDMEEILDDKWTIFSRLLKI